MALSADRAQEARQALAEGSRAEVDAAADIASAQRATHAAAAEAQRLRSQAEQALADAGGWAARHLETAAQLCDRPPPELTAPPADWRSSECSTPLLLLPLQGADDAGVAALASRKHGIVASALGRQVSAVRQLPAALLAQCRALDGDGAALLGQRDELLTHALTALLQYSIVVKQLLPGG